MTSTVTPGLLDLVGDLRHGESLAETPFGPLTATVICGRSDVWLVLRNRDTGLAARLFSCPGGCEGASARVTADGSAIDVRARSLAGRHEARIGVGGEPLPVVRWTAQITPSAPLRLPVRERDIYPLGPRGDPRTAQGVVEAAQRGLNTALLYLRTLTGEPRNMLYVQDLTCLNSFFLQSELLPDGIVGGEWPELGLLAAAPALGGEHEPRPLAAGESTVHSRGIVVFDDGDNTDPQDSAIRFIDLLAAAYPFLEKPLPSFHDWHRRAEGTVADLHSSSKVRTTYQRHTYLRPYVAAEYPDVMVQACVAIALREYGRAHEAEQALRLADRLSAGLPAFLDRGLGALRRYLPNVGSDKNADAVDSWYLYHPMVSLGRLASLGDDRAREVFVAALDYAVATAKHFDYAWPIQFDITDRSVITEARDGEGLGQTDVGGIYAYVMIQAFEITGDVGYVEEAVRAVDASMGARFDVNYQANLTAWGATACLRLWRVTGNERHRRQAYVYIASYLHNCQIWESEIRLASNYRTFFNPMCLHDAIYMAPYEAYDAFVAWEEALKLGGMDLAPSARHLISEHCAYLLDTTWWCYPDTLPPEALATSIRNGHIDPSLNLPLEDLYVDGQQAGQVGQEVYGAGAALAFAARMVHHNPEAPFEVFCDRFVTHAFTSGTRTWTFYLDTSGGVTEALLVVVRRPQRQWSSLRVRTEQGPVRPTRRLPDRWEYRVPHGSEVIISWN